VRKNKCQLSNCRKNILSPFTVDSHRKNLLAKLAVKNTAGLIRLAVKKNDLII
jgi:DNA-binding CsgD family transcriptional regulator